MENGKPTYLLSRWLFLRGLAVVFAIAFVSLWVQVDGLVGSRGVLPVAELLEAIRRARGETFPFQLPTLCWWDASDAFLHVQCGAGLLLAIALFAGVAPRLCLALLWLLYLSLATAGQVFLGFQWDALLLETAVFAIPFAPGSWLPGLSRERPPSPIALFLVRWLLVRLMLASGATKLAYGDASWLDGTAMTFHYWTQPLPTAVAWWVQRLPVGFHRASCFAMYAIEIGLPFLAFGARPLRRVAFAGLVLLQGLIALTGNYGFFNLLTVVLCVPLLDDGSLRRFLPRLGSSLRAKPATPKAWFGMQAAIAALVVLQTTLTMLANVRLVDSPSAPAVAVERALGPLRSLNDYGLFRVMTKERREIEIQGSSDGVAWRPYRFRWKPGPVDRAPPWVQPHMPRLDWQMWFASLGPPRSSPWLFALLQRLQEGSPEVLGLLAEDPFPGEPPRWIRAVIADYRFSDPEERAATGAWWEAVPLGVFVQPLERRSPR